MSVGDVWYKAGGHWTKYAIGGGGGSTKVTCTKTSHGFAVMDCISAVSGSGFIKTSLGTTTWPSQTGAECFVGIVESVTDENTFVLVPPGSTITTSGGAIGGTTFGAGVTYFASTTAGGLTINRPSQTYSNMDYCDLVVLIGIDSTQGVVQKQFLPNDRRKITDEVGGTLRVVGPHLVSYEQTLSNRIKLWDGYGDLICYFNSMSSFSNVVTDMGSVALAVTSRYDVFALFNAYNANPYLKLAKWASATQRSIAWGSGETMKIGYRRSNNGNVYACYINHTSGATDEPGVGANAANYWIEIGYDPYSFTDWSIGVSYVGTVNQVWHNGGWWYCLADNTASADDEPGVGVNTDTYWYFMGIKPDPLVWGLYKHETHDSVWKYSPKSTGSFDGRKYRFLGVIYTFSNGGTVEFRDSTTERSVANFYNRGYVSNMTFGDLDGLILTIAS